MAAPIIVASANGAIALPSGVAILREGGSALDAVEACARIVEENPLDVSVGLGGWPNMLGVVELDASIMDGETRRAGAVAALRGHLHATTVARAVMERSPHVLLAGEGAARFAREIGEPRRRLLTARTRKLWTEFLRAAGETPSGVRKRRAIAPLVMRTARLTRQGTVNFLALDRRGRMASAVSTCGWGYKYPGRVGDSPIIGAGNYCDSRYGAAACTGFGELALRGLLAKTAVDRLARRVPVSRVARDAIAAANGLDEGEPPPMNIVVLTPKGAHASATNRAGRRYAFMTTEMTEPETPLRAVVTRRAR